MSVFRVGSNKSSVNNFPSVRPTLDLDFANSKTLDPRITFTRASGGSYVGADGLIKLAGVNEARFDHDPITGESLGLLVEEQRTNLLLRSEEFDNASWNKGNSTVSANSAAAPDGMLTADKLVEAATTSAHSVFSNFAATGAVPATLSVYAKAAERSEVALQIFEGASLGTAVFNLVSGTIASGSGLITPAGNGWYRCSTTVTPPTGTLVRAFIITALGGGISYTGDGTSGIYLWGAQLEQSATVGEYIPTTSTINSAPRFDHNPTTGESLGLLVEEQRSNLLVQSENFGTTWTSFGNTVAINTASAPDGQTTADTLVPNNGQGTSGVTQVVPGGLADSTVYTFSVFIKFAGLTAFNLQFYNKANTFFGSRNLNPQTGLLSGSEFGGTTSVVAYPNGWYPLILANLNSGTGATAPNARIVCSATGDGVSGAYIWGAQLEAGAFPTSYIPTTTAAATRSADVASITGSNFGTTRTNLLQRSEEFQTGWTRAGVLAFGSGSVTDAAIAPNGTMTADLITEDTSVSSVHRVNQGCTVAAGSNTVSIYAKRANGIRNVEINANALTNAKAVFDLGNGAVGEVSNGTASIQSVGNGWYRCSVTGVSAGGTSTLFIQAATDTTAASSTYTGDGTSGIYLWGAQLETGSTATAYIPTTTAAASVFESSWYRQSEGTFLSHYAAGVSGARPLLASNSDAQERFEQRVVANFRQGTVTLAGVGNSEYADTGRALVAGTAWKHAIAQNGTTLAIGSELNVAQIAISRSPAVDRLWVGSFVGTGTFLNGHIRRLTYWPARLPNETLQQITR